MVQKTIAHLLIAIVLICPFFCLGETADVTVAHSAVIGCSCCDEPGESGGETPGSPDDDDSDCLCHGAIMDGPRAAEVDPSVLSAIHERLPSFADSSSAHVSAKAPCHFPPLSTGRDICALTSSLLL